ncbi:MAG: cytochrome c [Bdellovibrionales bacterium]|nr:cytochrome c [Bdellovibrionales bacterium]
MRVFSLLVMVFASVTAAGAANTSTCAACHGLKGVSVNPAWPNLAGQGKDYLVKQLLAFKNGERKDPLMGPVAAVLSEADIESIAEYYSKLSGGR